jgi:cyclic-di-GMP-binding protein
MAAADNSFDIVSLVDMQVMDDAINVSMREINNRFDLKSQNAVIEFNRGDKTIVFHAPSEFVVKQIKDILLQKLAKRAVSSKVLAVKKLENASGGTVRETNDIVYGINMDLARTMVKDIKGLNLKIQSSIMEDVIRVTGKNKDDLQAVIHFVREKDYPIPLQFTNYR